MSDENKIDDLFDWTKAPPSIGKDIFGMRARGEISHEKYLELNAMWIADTAHTFQPRPMRDLPMVLRDYAAQRAQGTTPRDQAQSQFVNQWFQETRFAFEETTKDFENLVWASKICRGAGQLGQVDKIEHALVRYRCVQPFPQLVVDLVMLALKRDWRDRKSREGGF